MTEQRLFRFLRRHGADYVTAVNLIPREDLTMILSAYQSFLWNEMVREIIRTWAAPVVEMRGVASRYAFYLALSSEAFAYLRGLQLPTPGPKVSFSDPYVEHVFRSALEREGISPQALALRRLTRAYFTSVPREVLLVPEDLELIERAPDDLYAGRMKAVIRFVLPRGTYGTMVLKRVTLRLDGMSAS